MFEDALDFDIDAIMEGTESTVDMLLDADEEFDAECEATVISDDIDDMAIDNIVGLDGLVTDDDIDAIDRGESPADANDPIEDDAEAGANDPEIFRLQKDLFQNTLLTDDDIKDLREGMSIEEFTARVLQEAEELPVINMGDPSTTQAPVRDECGTSGVCGECHHNPCICANPIEKHNDDHDDEDDDHSFSLEKDFEKVDMDDDFDDDDDDLSFDDLDDEVNAPMNVPAGPVQPLNDEKGETEDIANLPFAPTATNTEVEDTEIEDSLSKLEDNNEDEGDVQKMTFTAEEMAALENAYAEGYAKKLDELEAMAESAEEDSEELTEEEALLVEAYNIGYEEALKEVMNEGSEEEVDDTDVMVEDTDDIEEMLNSIQEGLEDIKIENEFEGSGINAEQKDANKGMFTGMEKNVDEPGGTTQNDTTLPFENVTVKGFSDIEDDSKACMIK